MDIYQQLKNLNLTLPAVATPLAAYVPYSVAGNLIFLSGHLSKKDGKVWVGKLGANMQVAEGEQAARATALDMLGTLHVACQSVGKDLNSIKRIHKLTGLVNSAPDFIEQHLVINGASNFFVEVFAENSAQVGKHARAAFGVASLPMGACVEVELVAELV